MSPCVAGRTLEAVRLSRGGEKRKHDSEAPASTASRSIKYLVVSTLVVLLLPSAMGEARRPVACAKKPGKTLLVTRDARVFKKRRQVYACLLKKRRTFRLGGHALPYGDDEIRDLRLRSRFVAYSLRRSSGRRIRVKELHRGRTIHDAKAALVSRIGFTALTDLRLTRNGSVAWIVRTQPYDVALKLYPLPEEFLPDFEVGKSDRTGQTLLDRGHDIAAGSLALRGTTLSWVRHGRRYSAVLN